MVNALLPLIAAILGASVSCNTSGHMPPGELSSGGSYNVRRDVEEDMLDRADLRVRYPFDVYVVGMIGDRPVRLSANLRLNYTITSFIKRKYEDAGPLFREWRTGLIGLMTEAFGSPTRKIVAVLDAIVGILGACALLSFLLRKARDVYDWIAARRDADFSSFNMAVVEEVTAQRCRQIGERGAPITSAEFDAAVIRAARNLEARNPRKRASINKAMTRLLTNGSRARSMVMTTGFQRGR